MTVPSFPFVPHEVSQGGEWLHAIVNRINDDGSRQRQPGHRASAIEVSTKNRLSARAGSLLSVLHRCGTLKKRDRVFCA